ncbi:MAG TPA: hypothetical protein VN812_23065 [Candidatus Acidoferrales bacterium]|nr:hypothetical protein [Candidatus Acidoferrales bacterium]
MLPIIAAVPAPLDITLGFSLVVPALGALALCCTALVLAVAQRAHTNARLWSAARPSYTCSVVR